MSRALQKLTVEQKQNIRIKKKRKIKEIVKLNNGISKECKPVFSEFRTNCYIMHILCNILTHYM